MSVDVILPVAMKSRPPSSLVMNSGALLKGVVVLEVSGQSGCAAAFATFLLVDMGSTVISLSNLRARSATVRGRAVAVQRGSEGRLEPSTWFSFRKSLAHRHDV